MDFHGSSFSSMDGLSFLSATFLVLHSSNKEMLCC
jgi:hypothetical protein